MAVRLEDQTGRASVSGQAPLYLWSCGRWMAVDGGGWRYNDCYLSVLTLKCSEVLYAGLAPAPTGREREGQRHQALPCICKGDCFIACGVVQLFKLENLVRIVCGCGLNHLKVENVSLRHACVDNVQCWSFSCVPSGK